MKHLKYYFTHQFLALFLLVFLPAQDDSGIAATGSVGTVTINGQIYNQLAIRPEIPIGNMGLALDIYLYFNDDGMYWESWDFSSGSAAYRTIIDKIYYLRWGQPGDNLYFLAGAIPSATLGHGILVNNYANIIEYPQVRQVGLNLEAHFAGVGLEFLHSNFKETAPGVIGLRGSYTILPNLSAGASFATDLNQYAGLRDSDGDGYPDYYDFYPDDPDVYDDSLYWRDIYFDINPNSGQNDFLTWYVGSEYENSYTPATAEKDPVSGVAFDLTYSLSENLTLYSQFAKLIGNINDVPAGADSIPGWGLVPIGLAAKLGPVDFNAELRSSSANFLFNYWNRSYDLNRINVDYTEDESYLYSKESQLYRYGAMNGFYAHASAGFMNLLVLGVGYQDMRGEIWDDETSSYVDDANKTFLTTLGLSPSFIPKLRKVEAFYQQSNVPNPFEFTPSLSTIWGYDVGLEVSAGVMLLYKVRTTYIPDPDSETGDLIPVESIQIETQILF